MTTMEFEKAVSEGKLFLMRQYKAMGLWSAGKVVTAEVAARKARIWVYSDKTGERYCPYHFELA